MSLAQVIEYILEGMLVSDCGSLTVGVLWAV